MTTENIPSIRQTQTPDEARARLGLKGRTDVGS
jgi:hypothetical protein